MDVNGLRRIKVAIRGYYKISTTMIFILGFAGRSRSYIFRGSSFGSRLVTYGDHGLVGPRLGATIATSCGGVAIKSYGLYASYDKG